MNFAANRTVFITLAVLLLLLGYCAAQFPFVLSTRVLGNLLTDNAFLGVIAVGMTVVIISGGIDLSVGSVLAFVGVLLGVLITQQGVDPLLAFAIVLVIGTAFGALQGAAIHLLGAPAFIVTLAGMFLLRGACFLLTEDSIPINHPLYTQLASAGVPLPGGGQLSFAAGIMLLIIVAAGVMLRRTEFGASVYGLGGDARAAELMGVRAGRATVRIYAFSGFTAAIGGILYSLYTSSAYPLAGIGLELDAIAATIIGGTLLTGGYGGVFGTLLGVLILGVIQLYITLEGTLSSWVAKIATGALLLLFIGAQRFGRAKDH
ncbi:sugar ABC transporter permease YjfF [Sphingomonas piscis]|uniref:Sugar ABC transporter permease YjfF n=1 Tax=Sphingomonas piscis TaxID=2714943 RepID=A0A6G7YQH1_9SPHN|nr:galactofuranose ABC transporter, permease protein YjfF [Sphingomonas piscis]QIK78990.1 sugar ABC transporter permease YjfF [Sphingomonas piscis]